MTTLDAQQVTCAVCNVTNEYMTLGSTNQFGPRDLDTRPGEMMRSTMAYWIQCCPSCGYCTPDLSVGAPHASAIVASETYRHQRAHRAYPELANAFLCWSLIQEAAGKDTEAGWAAVHAAWACDDARASEAADDCRGRAIALFGRAQAGIQSFGGGPAYEAVMMADLHRRSGRFDAVPAICQAGLRANPEEIVGCILVFQQALAARRDRERYTVDDVPTTDIQRGGDNA